MTSSFAAVSFRARISAGQQLQHSAYHPPIIPYLVYTSACSHYSYVCVSISSIGAEPGPDRNGTLLLYL